MCGRQRRVEATSILDEITTIDSQLTQVGTTLVSHENFIRDKNDDPSQNGRCSAHICPHETCPADV